MQIYARTYIMFYFITRYNKYQLHYVNISANIQRIIFHFYSR